MYHVIRNQHLDDLRQASGRIVLLCRQGEAGERIARLVAQALGRPVEVQTPGQALPSRGGGWVVPVQVVRSRFSRGDDAWSRLSRRLGAQRHGLADRLNHWLGARVELVCGTPVPADDADSLAAAAERLQDDHRTPLVPTIHTLWPGVKAAVQETVGAVDDRALRQLAKMANRYRLAAATALRGTVHYLSRRFFRGIWTYGMAGIEGLPPGARIVYLPCHRSHLDYMVLPYALNELGQTCPVIAAGDNLNFFAIGRLLQEGFAFYIRRTFGNDAAYRALCAAYIGESLRGGVPVAFFPEGGRSRDGWMRSPKVGMLQMIREQLDRDGDASGPTYVVPVHLAYERCPDGNSLAKQTLGRAKRQESIFRLAKSLKVLVADHGRVFLSFGTPLALTGLQGQDEDAAKASTMAVARQVLQQINSQVVVTGPALVAVSLIARDRQATVGDLTADSARLARYVAALATATAWPVIIAPDHRDAAPAHRGVVRLPGRPMGRTDQDGITCERNLALLGLETRDGLVACPQPLVSARIDWHWGAVGHLLAPLGFVARHLALGGTLKASDLHTLAATFDQVRQDPTFRLHWPEETPSAAVLAAVTTFLATEGLLTPDARGGFEPVDSPLWQGWSHLVPAGEPGAAEGKAVATP